MIFTLFTLLAFLSEAKHCIQSRWMRYNFFLLLHSVHRLCSWGFLPRPSAATEERFAFFFTRLKLPLWLKALCSPKRTQAHLLRCFTRTLRHTHSSKMQVKRLWDLVFIKSLTSEPKLCFQGIWPIICVCVYFVCLCFSVTHCRFYILS